MFQGWPDCSCQAVSRQKSEDRRPARAAEAARRKKSSRRHGQAQIGGVTLNPQASRLPGVNVMITISADFLKQY
jgi:hypothetical protein